MSSQTPNRQWLRKIAQKFLIFVFFGLHACLEKRFKFKNLVKYILIFQKICFGIGSLFKKIN